MDSRPLHVVFGAGQIGARLARLLVERGQRVRVVRRSGKSLGSGIELRTGDARDPAFALAASDGASVIYHCMNPTSYSATAWEREFPMLGESLVNAAVARGARLVCLDNLYAYGPCDTPLDETMPAAPNGRKGAVRAAWAERLESAHGEHGLDYVLARAADYFGPGASEALVAEAVVRGMLSGKRPYMLGDPNAPHAFSYIPDVAEALVLLGTASELPDRVVHLPVHEVSQAELYARLAVALDVKTAPRRASSLLVRALAPVVPLFRNLLETLYQWEKPFRVDDSRFRKYFPHPARSLDEAVRETARSVQSAEERSQAA